MYIHASLKFPDSVSCSFSDYWSPSWSSNPSTIKSLLSLSLLLLSLISELLALGVFILSAIWSTSPGAQLTSSSRVLTVSHYAGLNSGTLSILSIHSRVDNLSLSHLSHDSITFSLFKQWQIDFKTSKSVPFSDFHFKPYLNKSYFKNTFPFFSASGFANCLSSILF